MDSRVLQTQKWLNDTYGNVANFPKVDEDGITGNSTFHALIYALQIEIGVENPDGIFGKDTLRKCPTLRASLLPSSEVPRNIIYILQGSLWCKGISPGGFTGVFGPLTANAISEFQTAAGITADKVVYPYVLQGIMNTDSYSFQSTEDIYDTDRNATALDTSTKLTLEDAIAIKQKNYTDVGRYLTNASSNGLDKALTLDEMEILIAVGLNVFPIFQTIGNKVSYFTAQQGLADGLAAKEAAQKFGFPPSATIYFCVDYDVLMADIEGNILPYFKNVKAALNNAYKMGAYGPRYICTKLAEMNLTTSSFVCDMSSGFTCNIGHKLPDNWAYDQFAEVASANSTINNLNYDKCIASPRKTATAPDDFLSCSVGYDNSRYSYEQVHSGIGYYQPDSKSRYSSGVKVMQDKLNTAGYDCGTPDGIFSTGTANAVNNLKQDNGLSPNSRVDKDTLTVLESCKPTSNGARNLKRRLGSHISSTATQYNIDEDILGGIILTESLGEGFVNGKLLIRFENKTFLNRTNNSDASSVFKIENDASYYYINEQWIKTHGNGQTSEYEAFELAKNYDEKSAYESISMGLPQIMGFNHTSAGYDSAQNMFDDFYASEVSQVSALGKYIVTYNDGILLSACHDRNLFQIAKIYNGNGEVYKPILEKSIIDYDNAL